MSTGTSYTMIISCCIMFCEGAVADTPIG